MRIRLVEDELTIPKRIEFIDPNVRFWMRTNVGIVVILGVFVYLFWPKVKAIDLGDGDHTVKSPKTVVIERPPTKSPASNPPPIEKPPVERMEPKPEPKNDSQGTIVELHSQAVEPEDEQLAATEPPVEPQSNPANEPTAPPSTIIAGKTAPHYCLESLGVYKQLARDKGCRFLVTDRNVSIEIGRLLNTNAPVMRMVTSAWHEQYAKRMIPLPRNAEVDRVVESVRKNYPQLGRDARVFLSVPHTLDRAIYDAQKKFLGQDWDVNCVTLITPRGLGFQVVRVME